MLGSALSASLGSPRYYESSSLSPRAAGHRHERAQRAEHGHGAEHALASSEGSREPREQENGDRGSQASDGGFLEARDKRRSVRWSLASESEDAEEGRESADMVNRFAWRLEAENPDKGVRSMLDRHAAGPGFNKRSRCRKRVGEILSWTAFDLCLGVVICLNGVTIGLETVYSRKEEPLPRWVETWNTVVFSIYALELFLRFYAFGCGVFRSSWVRFDTFLVVADSLDLIFKSVTMEDGVVRQVISVDMLKMLRLIRLARAVRLMVQFKVLWQFVQGVVNSCLTLVWTFVFLFMFMYLFALCGMELIRTDPNMPPEYDIAASKFDDGLGGTLLLLIQLLTLDSVGAVYRPLILNKPILSVYFVGFILVVSIALMNLVTAIMVESSMRTAEEDMECRMAWQDAQRKKVVPKLRSLFEELDQDGSGMLDREELTSANELLKTQLSAVSKLVNLEELFLCLDYDHSGAVTIEEFCDGVLNTRADKPLELFRIMRQNSEILHTIRVVYHALTGEDHVPHAPRHEEGEDGGVSAALRAAAPKGGNGQQDQAAEAPTSAEPHSPRPTLSLVMERLGMLEAHLRGLGNSVQTMNDSLRSVAEFVRDRPRCSKVTEVEAQVVGKVVGKVVVNQGTSVEDEAEEAVIEAKDKVEEALVDQAVVKQVTAEVAQQLSAEVVQQLSMRRDKDFGKQANIEPILVNLENFLREFRSMMRPDTTPDGHPAKVFSPQRSSANEDHREREGGWRQAPMPWDPEPGGWQEQAQAPTPRATEPMLSPSKLQISPTRPCTIGSEEDAEIPPPPVLMLPEVPPNPAADRVVGAAFQHGHQDQPALWAPQPELPQTKDDPSPHSAAGPGTLKKLNSRIQAASRAKDDGVQQDWKPGKWWPLEDDPGGTSPSQSGSALAEDSDKAAL